MDNKMICIEITKELFNQYPDYIDRSIDCVRLVHLEDDVVLEITKIETTAKGMVKETISRTDLGFIANDPEQPMFSVEC